MNGKNHESPNGPLRKIKVSHHTYQSIQPELNEDARVDATFEEVLTACLQSVKIKYVKPKTRQALDVGCRHSRIYPSSKKAGRVSPQQRHTFSSAPQLQRTLANP